MTAGAIALLCAAAPAASETFAATLAAIADGHPRLESARQTALAGRADVNAARAVRRPQVALVGDVGYTRNALTSKSDSGLLPGIRATQLLYDGGRSGAEIARRGFRADALTIERERALFDLGQRLADAWLEWSRQRALLAIADRQVAALRELSQTVRSIAGFDQGRASDVALVATRLSQSESARDQRRIAIADARAVIRQIAAADVEPEGDMPAVEALLPPTLEAAFADAGAHPLVRVADLEIREAGAAVDAAKGWWRPQLSLDAGSQSDSTLAGRSRLFGTIELKLRSSLTPIDGGGGSSRLQSARAQASAARLDAVFTERSLRDEVARQWVSVSERRSRLPQLSVLVTDTDASRDVVAEQFRIGRRSILDLLSFEVERFGARTQLENERRDLLAAEYRLLSVTGRLVPGFVPGAAAPTGKGAL